MITGRWSCVSRSWGAPRLVSRALLIIVLCLILVSALRLGTMTHRVERVPAVWNQTAKEVFDAIRWGPLAGVRHGEFRLVVLGLVREQGSYRYGEPDGEWIIWDEDGAVMSYGRVHRGAVLHEQSAPPWPAGVENQTPLTGHYENVVEGRVICSGQLIDGEQVGTWSYFAGGELSEQFTYEEGDVIDYRAFGEFHGGGEAPSDP